MLLKSCSGAIQQAGWLMFSAFLFFAAAARAQDKPYFVTYTYDLEEPGNLEIESKTAFGRPDGGERFGTGALELEYGARAWWTTELYLDGQTTAGDSTVGTGFRWENRFRPILRELAVNPVIYVEYENISEADKNVLEVVGHDAAADLAARNGETRGKIQHEAELKLILSTNRRAWNFSGNFIAEKNLGHAPWEFGYALGAARPLRTAASGGDCTFCAERFTGGVELYGGLGDTDSLTLRETSHYVAPVVGWQLPKGLRLSGSVGFGLSSSSLDRIYRAGLAVEIPQFGSLFHSNAGGGR